MGEMKESLRYPLVQWVQPSKRMLAGLVIFVALAYTVSRSERLIIPVAVHWLRDKHHFDFKSHFGPTPAVPVNLLTIIVTIRSIYALLITWIAQKIEGRPWGAIGYDGHGWLQKYCFGLLTGFVSMTVIVGLMLLSDALTFDGLRLHGTDAVMYGLRWLFGLLMVGIAEECIDRGYALVTIARIFGTLPAVLLTSLVFAVGHATNPGESILGLVQILLFGQCAL